MSAADDAKRLSVNLDAWLAKSEKAARLKFVDVCLEAAERIVDRTPVDTGFCRSMWSVSIGSPPIAAPVDRPDGFAAAKGGAAGRAALGRIEASILGVKLEQQVWLYNATKYAPALENGSSGQAPHGMVGITVQELRAKYA